MSEEEKMRKRISTLEYEAKVMELKWKDKLREIKDLKKQQLKMNSKELTEKGDV